MTTFNFSQPKDTKRIWQTISSSWSHHDRPEGQRFLGSIQINRQHTERVLTFVGYNLRKLDTVTYDKLYESFHDPEQNWLKIITFALSEYAYYDSSVTLRFWHGLCEKLKLPYSQGKENTFRKILDKGFNLLGIVQAKGGYRYVSTLWLQNGIPQQNLQHFSKLVQDFSNEYGWWEIAHSSCEDISEELFSFCQKKYPQWRTLINFLEASCPQKENEEVEPISGQLLQGIAIVAVELEHQGILPEKLKNDKDREKLLGNYYLPNNFFLRNWDSLIQVLTPKQRRLGSSCKIIRSCQKPLSLVLDVTDSLNMQLLLPEQSLWKKGWENLSGTFCQIPEAIWEGMIPLKPGLMIPEQVVNIREIPAEPWKWQLLDHRRKSLTEWELEGLTKDFPCLIFDAGTCDRLNLDSANPTIRGTKEIICFTPKDVRLDFENGIEILDSCVPSSIRGWRGQQLTLTKKESSIVFKITTGPLIGISWKLSSDEQPSLRGLKLKGKKSIYLEIPTFWYPPIEEEICLKVSIENITYQKIVITTTEIVQPSNRWQAIPLHKWITEPGKYEARFWTQFDRWSYKFEIKSNYEITSKPEIKNLKISCGTQSEIDQLPILCDSADNFWSKEIKIKGLFPLETISLSLYEDDEQATIFSECQADSLGDLYISLTSFYNLLSTDSNLYELHFKRLGWEQQCLIKIKIENLEISCNLDNQAIHLSGLLSNEVYSLSCWNLLLPEKPEIKITRIALNEDTIIVPLEVPTGIYHIELLGSRKLRQNLGWWCGSNQNDLPDETLENEDLADYCYTILGNESVDAFIKAANKFDYDCDLLETALDSLKSLPYYLPEWLQINSLGEKLQALIKNLKVQVQNPASMQEVKRSKIADTGNVAATKENWLLITLTNSSKREFVYQRINLIIENIEKNNIQKENGIYFPIDTPCDSYKNILLLKCKSINIKSHIYQIKYIKDIQRLESNKAQRILGA